MNCWEQFSFAITLKKAHLCWYTSVLDTVWQCMSVLQEVKRQKTYSCEFCDLGVVIVWQAALFATCPSEEPVQVVTKKHNDKWEQSHSTTVHNTSRWWRNLRAPAEEITMENLQSRCRENLYAHKKDMQLFRSNILENNPKNVNGFQLNIPWRTSFASGTLPSLWNCFPSRYFWKPSVRNNIRNCHLQMQELKELQYKEDQLKKKEEKNTQNFNRMIFLTLWALKTSQSD